jgi:anaerobic selenocysteine-containing dehydrogenase
MAGAFAWQDFRAALNERLQGLLGQGFPSATSVSRLVKEMRQSGGWWSPEEVFENWQTAFQTPSGKFEFYSQTIASQLKKVFPHEQDLNAHLEAAGVVTRGDDLCLPHWEPPRWAGDPAPNSFFLVVYRGIEYAEGGARHLPLLRELPSAGRTAWQSCCDLNPADAARLHIKQGQSVRLTSTAGTLLLTVRLVAGIQPGMIGLPLGQGVWPPGDPLANPAGGYPLMANHSDPLAGILAVQGTRVRIEKVGAR